MTSVWKQLGGLVTAGHDALDVDEHHVHGPGGDGQLLLQEVAGDRHAVPHEDLVGGAADAGEVDAVQRPPALAFSMHLRLAGHVDDGISPASARARARGC